MSFAVPGTVAQVLVQEGDVVRRGQTLAVLSARSYQDALGIAQAKGEQAEDAFRRLEPMFRNQTLPEVKMVEVETGRAQARFAISMARKDVDDTVLRAPVDGVIARRQVEPGTTAAPGLPVVTIVQTSTVLATASVPEREVVRFRKGDHAGVVVPALGKVLDGTIREIAVLANPLTRSFEVKVALPNPAGDLRVGMVAEVRLMAPGDAVALVVPPEAVRVDELGAPFAFVVAQDHSLHRRPVSVGGYSGESTVITSGLAQGDSVVTSGTPMLAEGMLVRDVPRPAGAVLP